ncbi:MAG: class I SAM-dependent methyltransferase [Nanoarchaeota archaeon]
MGRQPIRGHFSRSRSLSDFNEKMKPFILEDEIAKRYRTDTNILEIGCGEGRVLLELAKRFPDASLTGINKKPWPAMLGQRSLRRAAVNYRIFTAREVAKIKLPTIIFDDASSLGFPSGSINVLYSQVAIHYVARKDLLLEETWRVLRKGGIAILHMDTYNHGYPDFLPPDTPRFIVYRSGRHVPFARVIKEAAGKTLDITCKHTRDDDSSRTTIVMRKNSTRPLELRLEYDDAASFPLYALQQNENRHEDIFWGHRSVYHASPAKPL